jgi:hypothetical protein
MRVMNRSHRVAAWSVSIAAALAAGGCGSSGNSGGSATQTTGSADALSAEAKSQATGDIPDNQVFLVFRNAQAGYAIKYPEGWSQAGAGGDVTFKDKNNLVHISIAAGSAPAVSSAAAELDKLKKSDPSLVVTAPSKQVTIKGNQAIKSGYSTESKPNPVTGKRVTLLVDRYQFAHNGKVATVDLGTPKGVDNVDAYRLMSESFKWR